jgi:hypothetical protein
MQPSSCHCGNQRAVDLDLDLERSKSIESYYCTPLYSEYVRARMSAKYSARWLHTQSMPTCTLTRLNSTARTIYLVQLYSEYSVLSTKPLGTSRMSRCAVANVAIDE